MFTIVHDKKLSNLFKDRVKVYQILNDNKIETPRYIVCDRSDLENMPEFEEFDDYLEINGETFHKPFVEKPVRYESYRMTKSSFIKFWDRLFQTKSKTVDFRDVGRSTFLLLEMIFSAENHRINIYYPTTAGGGHQKLFRKVLNRSSEYCQELILKRYQAVRGTLIFVRSSIGLKKVKTARR